MPQARNLVLPPQAVGTYHVLSRCTRREFLLGGKYAHRRTWVAGLLADLLDGFAIDLHAFAIMSNHVHLVLRPRPDLASSWSARQVATRGLTHIPVRSGAGLEALPVTRTLTERYAENTTWVSDHRERLSSLTWFMKLFKQRLSRRANAEDDCRGHFWEARFLSVPLLDMGAVIGCMAYVDRNPLRAKMVNDPALAVFTSIAHRLSAAGIGAKPSFFNEEDRHLGSHLTPLTECRPVEPLTGERPRSTLTLDDYRALVVPGKPTSEAARVCTELGINPSAWSDAQREGGRFQGVAVGSRTARAAFARTQGKQIIADKTGVWEDEK
jgi:REP element-mobilizing transposase RayT